MRSGRYLTLTSFWSSGFSLPGRLPKDNLRGKILTPKHLIHHTPHQVDILIPDLHKDAAGLGQQVAGHHQAVAQVCQVGMDAELPGVAEGAHLFGLARGVLGLASFTSRLRVLTCQLEPNLMP